MAILVASRRLVAGCAAALIMASCGTRLDDAAIRRAAGVDAANTGGELAVGSTPAVANQQEAAAPTSAPGEIPEAEAATPTAPAAAVTATPTPGPFTPTAGTPSASPVAASSGAAGSGGQTAPGKAATPASAPSAGRPASVPAATKARAPIVFGHIGDYSGVVGTVLRGGDVTARVVARFINDRGGLDGHPVQLITADAGGDPARALALVREMVEAKGAVAFVGNAWVFSGYGPREYLEAHHIPVIGGDSTTRVWFESPMYFPSAASFPAISFGALKGLVDAGKRKVGVLYCVEAEQCKVWYETAAAKAASIGADIVYAAQVSLAQPDFTAECIQAQRNGAEGIMAGLDSPSVVRFARACAQQSYRPQLMNATLAVIEAAAKDKNTDGMLAIVGTFPHMANDTPAAREYHDAMQRYAPSVADSPTTSTIWTAGALLREVSRALPDTVASTDFFPRLYAITNNTLGGLVGPLTFNEGKAASPINCVFRLQVSGGRFTAPAGSRQQCF